MKSGAEGGERTRGRPRGFDPEVVLERALMVFWAQGYEGASIADLTQAMEITAPSLYAAFGSKLELYRRVLALYRARRSKTTLDLLAEEPTAFAAIRKILYGAASEFSDRRHPPGCMIATAVLKCAPENEEAAKTAAALRVGSVAALTRRFEEALASGELRPGTAPHSLARFYGAIVQGLSVQAQDGADEATLQGIVEIALTAWPGGGENKG